MGELSRYSRAATLHTRQTHALRLKTHSPCFRSIYGFRSVRSNYDARWLYNLICYKVGPRFLCTYKVIFENIK